MDVKEEQGKLTILLLFIESAILLFSGMIVGFIVHKIISFGNSLTIGGYSFAYPLAIVLSLLLILAFIFITYKHIKRLTTTYNFAVINVFFLLITTMVGTFLPQWGTFDASVTKSEYYSNFSASFFTFMASSWYWFIILLVLFTSVFILFRNRLRSWWLLRLFIYLVLGISLCLSIVFRLFPEVIDTFSLLASNIIIISELHDFYHSGPYVSLYIFLLISLVKVALTKPLSWRFTGFHLVHISLIIIVIAAWIDFFLGFKGIINLYVGKSSNNIQLYNPDFMGNKEKKLDFYLRLDNFETKKYNPDFHIYLAKVNQGDKEVEVETPSGKKAIKKRSKNKVLSATPLGLGNSQKVYDKNISYRIVKYLPDFYIRYINFPNRLSKYSFENEVLPRVKNDRAKKRLLSTYSLFGNEYILKKDIYSNELLGFDIAELFSSIPDDVLSTNIDIKTPGLLTSMSSGKVEDNILFRPGYKYKDHTNGALISLVWDFSKEDGKALLHKVRGIKRQSKHYIKLVNGANDTVKTFFKPGDIHKVDNLPYKIRLDKFYKYFYIKEKKVVNDSSNPINPAVELSLIGDKEDISFMLFENYNFPLPNKVKEKLMGLELGYSYEPEQRNKVIIAGKAKKIYSMLGDNTIKVEDIEFNKPYIFGDSKAAYTFIKMYKDMDQVYPLPTNALPYQRNPLVLLEVKVGDSTKLTYLPNIRDGTASYRYDLPNSDYILYLDSSKQATTKYWESTLSIVDGKNSINKAVKTDSIRVNEYMEYNGYRFYQTNASDDNPSYSGIGITYEPGLYIVYFGFVVLAVGTFITLYMKPRDDLKESG